MPNLSDNFRESFIDYLKDIHSDKNKENLANSAFAIYEDAVKNFGLEPDNYLNHVQEIIKSAIQGIKVNADIAKAFEDYIRFLSRSDSEKENRTFHALNITYHLTFPEKYCLREIINNFLILQDKLAREYSIITNGNFAGSFFINNSDISNLRGKKYVIENLIQFTSDEVFNKSREEGNKFFLSSYDVNQKIQSIEKHIDYLSQKECKQILHGLIQKINPILNAQGNPDEIRDDPECMTDSEKKYALKIHSFNDKWFFTFIAKIVKTMKELIGIKTSAENLLENSVDAAEKTGATLK